MAFLKRYLFPRLIQYVLVTWLGLTIVFIIPRLMPTDPVSSVINELNSRGAGLDPASVNKLAADLTELYGLKGSIFDQYLAFWGRLFRGDFGVSYFQFPTPVIKLIAQAMPFTLGLLLVTTIVSWIVGNIIGGLAGYYTRKGWSRGIDAVAMFFRPLPYYILAFGLLLLFGYVLRWFPITGAAQIGRLPSFTWSYIYDVIRHAALPALSIIIIGVATWFQTMKLVVQNYNAENFVQYAKLGGVTEDRIISKYVIRNALLPQITGLTLMLGTIFGGNLITELVFSYPGLGTLLVNAITRSDYNLIMGICVFTIVGVTTTILIADLLYPLLDPRIRYS